MKVHIEPPLHGPLHVRGESPVRERFAFGARSGHVLAVKQYMGKRYCNLMYCAAEFELNFLHGRRYRLHRA